MRFPLSITCVLTALANTVHADNPAATVKIFNEEIEPILAEYCYDCHGDGMDKGDFKMDDFDTIENHMLDQGIWFEIWESMRASLMPPSAWW